jgi:hypothetical protein
MGFCGEKVRGMAFYGYCRKSIPLLYILLLAIEEEVSSGRRIRKRKQKTQTEIIPRRPPVSFRWIFLDTPKSTWWSFEGKVFGLTD